MAAPRVGLQKVYAKNVYVVFSVPMELVFGKEKDDDHDQDPLPKDICMLCKRCPGPHYRCALPRRRERMTMTPRFPQERLAANGGENGPENEKNGPENGKNSPKMVRKWNLGPFFSFSGPCFPHFSGEAKIHFSAIFVPISGRRPEMDLYQVHGIPRP